ncbi:motility associated factor glycosyltransferase family protein [bacterium]|nr:motility associated factor glycosyltransferase family protein [bacterium]
MENKVLSENIEQIKQYDINLANKILMCDLEKSNIQLAQNENQEYNLIFNSIPLHSTLSAIEEAKKIAQNVQNKKNHNAIRIVYGLGLGYLPDEFSRSIGGKIIIYEPNIQILKFVFSIAKIDAMNKENVILCSNKKDLQTHIQNLANENTELTISFLNSYKSFCLDDIKLTLECAQKIQGEMTANKNTFLRKAPRVFCHTLYNLKHIFSNPNIVDLKDIYKNKTAIILCAGPSLKENIETIKNNQDKFVIFALNPTLKLLSSNGIKPDFIVNIENSNTIEQFSTTDVKNHYCIFEAFSAFAVSRLKTRKTFNYISKDNFFNFWVRDCLKLTDNLESYGTVSYTALMSAFIMGFSRIILIGQDLAYKNGQCYSKECQFGQLECIYDENEKKYKIIVQDFEKYAQAFYVNTITIETARKLAQERLEFLNKNLATVKSQENKDIPSQSGYALFIETFREAAIKLKQERPELQLINSSTGGAQIDGYENIKLENIVETLEPFEKLNLDNYQAKIDKNYVVSKMSLLEEKLSQYLKYIQDFNALNQKLLKELKNKNIFTQNCEKMILKHKEIFSSIINLKNDENVGFIVNVYLHIYEKYLRFNYFANVETAKETLENLIKDYLEVQENICNSLKGLSYCKTFILK